MPTFWLINRVTVCCQWKTRFYLRARGFFSMLVSLEEKMSKSILCSQSIWFFFLNSRSPHFALVLATDFCCRWNRSIFREKTLSRQSNLSVSYVSAAHLLLRNRSKGKKHKNIMLLVHFGVSFLLFIDKGKKGARISLYPLLNQIKIYARSDRKWVKIKR